MQHNQDEAATHAAMFSAFDDEEADDQLTQEELDAVRQERAAQRAQEHEARYGATLDRAIATFNGTPTPRQFTLHMRERELHHQRDMVQGVADLLVQRLQIADMVTQIAFRDLYADYRRYEQMVKFNIAQFEGGSCSTDKARVLLNRIYPAYLTGAPNPEPHTEWNTPRADLHGLWCAVIQSYGRFDMGDHQEFVDRWRKLVHTYQQDAPHCESCGW